MTGLLLLTSRALRQDDRHLLLEFQRGRFHRSAWGFFFLQFYATAIFPAKEEVFAQLFHVQEFVRAPQTCRILIHCHSDQSIMWCSVDKIKMKCKKNNYNLKLSASQAWVIKRKLIRPEGCETDHCVWCCFAGIFPFPQTDF